jgi:hypothetical protein
MESARLVHHIEGRTRFRVSGRRGDVDWFASVVKHLGTLDGVASIAARPETGSILLTHHLALDQITAFARDRNLFSVEPEDDVPALSPVLLASAAPLLTLGRWEAIAVATLTGMAIIQTLRGEVFGPAVSHAIQAADIIRRKWN